MRKVLYYTVVLLSTLVVIATLLSLLHDIVYWYFKALDFPRLQYLVVAAGCLPLLLFLSPRRNLPTLALALGLAASIFIQISFIYPYVLGPTPVAAATTAEDGRGVDIVVANVLTTNRRADAFIQLIRESKPDLLLAMEVNDWWDRNLTPLEAAYPHRMKYPADNGYGMSLYSRYPLRNGETEFLRYDSIPSMHAEVVLPGGGTFMFHGVHPLAPVPSDRYPDGAGKREVALAKIADKVDDYSLPTIVAGDFNDVSWSNTSRLFQGRTKLNNVRLGRGLYPTFDARSSIMRWPLDHYFVSQDVELAELKRLPPFGSDHFALYASFVLP